MRMDYEIPVSQDPASINCSMDNLQRSKRWHYPFFPPPPFFLHRTKCKEAQNPCEIMHKDIQESVLIRLGILSIQTHPFSYSVSEMRSLKHTEGLTTSRLRNRVIEGDCPAKVAGSITTIPSLVCS